MTFDQLLERFASAVGARDTAGLAALFTADGIYDDYFFGPHQGRESIAAMLDRFYDGGEAFSWEFVEPACSADTGYARYCFSYRSREPDSLGELVIFEGISRFRLRDGLIAEYRESVNGCVAMSQLGVGAERMAKVARKWSDRLLATPESIAFNARAKGTRVA